MPLPVSPEGRDGAARSSGWQLPAATAVVVLGALAGLVCATIWPVTAVLLGVVLLSCAIALRAPVAGFLLALVVVGCEGLLKARLVAEDVPSGLEVGALAIDFTLAVASASLLWRDRGASLRTTWGAGGRAEHVFWGLLAAWLALSVVQIPFSPRIVDAVQGLRLTQAYFLLVLVGIALVPVARGRDWVRGLLWAMTPIAAYAAFRAAVDPPAWVTDYSYERTPMNQFGELLRDVGSFSSVVALASFLVPVAVFSLVLGALRPRYRLHAWVVFALSTVAVIDSYVRIAIVAIAAGVAVVGLLLLVSRGVTGRAKVTAVLIALAVAGGLYGSAVLAGGASSSTETRAKGLSDPLADQSLKIRWKTWSRSVNKIRHEPLGTGLGTVGHATQEGRRESFTDNSYLKVFQEQGLLGGLLFTLGVIGTAVLVGRRLARGRPTDDPVAIAALAAFVSFLVLCVLGEYIEQAGKAVAWTLLGVALWSAYGASSRPGGARARGDDRDV